MKFGRTIETRMGVSCSIYRVKLVKLAMSVPSLVPRIDPMLSRVKLLVNQWTAISPNTAGEMPHRVDQVHVENVPHLRMSNWDKGTESHHETLNILTAKQWNRIKNSINYGDMALISNSCSDPAEQQGERRTRKTTTLYKTVTMTSYGQWMLFNA